MQQLRTEQRVTAQHPTSSDVGQTTQPDEQRPGMRAQRAASLSLPSHLSSCRSPHHCCNWWLGVLLLLLLAG